MHSTKSKWRMRHGKHGKSILIFFVNLLKGQACHADDKCKRRSGGGVRSALRGLL